MITAPTPRGVSRPSATRCVACGRAISADDEVVAVASEHLHAKCALYQPRRTR